MSFGLLRCVLTLVVLCCLVPCFGQDALQREWLVRGVPDPSAIALSQGSGAQIFATGPGIAVWESPDLRRWKRVGRVFSDAVPAWAKEKIPGADSVWAPDIHEHNGRRFLYYSVSTFGSQRSVIGLAINTHPDSTQPDQFWQDKGLVIESFPERDDFNAIDPAAFHDGDRAWLVWGSYWTGIKGTKIDPTTGKPIASPPEIVSLAARESTGPTAIEAPFVVRRGDWFYLFVSWDFCCAQERSTYKILVGRSRQPLGPYVDHTGRRMTQGGGRLVLMSDRRWRGPGHNSVLHTADGDWLVYHVVDAESPQSGRILQLRKLLWKDGWPQAGAIRGQTAAADRGGRVVGRWVHTVNNRDRYDIFFEPTGEITGTRGHASWELQQDTLLMKWHDPAAPGGMWIDRVTLAEDGRTYFGRNQNGVPIFGRFREF